MDQNRIRRVAIILLPILAMLVFVVGLYLAETKSGLVFGQGEGSCSPAPAPYREVSNIFAIDNEGNDVFIVRGIVGDNSEYVLGKDNLVFPACWSNEEALTTVANKFIIIDNKPMFLIVGVIGRQSQQAEEPLPLPAP